MRSLTWLIVGIFTSIFFAGVLGTVRYYGSYLVFGTGDTFINTQNAHGGPRTPFRKWNVECLDGEAVIGIRDFVNDFQRIIVVLCKFLFPYKPPTNGLYPYYNFCHVRNLSTQAFCFDPNNITQTLNTFVTALYDNDFQFRLDRPRDDRDSLYKCCTTPPGYYIDYHSCYYKYTHDHYYEYYDDVNHNVVFCNSGYLVTGMFRKINPWDNEYHMDFIQCCRVGFQSMPQPGASQIPVIPPRTPTGRQLPEFMKQGRNAIDSENEIDDDALLRTGQTSTRALYM